MTEYVRVKDKQTGHEYTVPAHRFDPAGMTRLNKPALTIHGDPAPVKFKTTATKAAKKSAK